jgi:hypothetical protein
VCALVLLALASISSVRAADRDPQSITPFVAAAIPLANAESDGDNSPILVDLLPSGNDLPLLLATDLAHSALLVRATPAGFETIFRLQIGAFDLHIVEGTENTLWIGGVRGATVSTASTQQSYAYLTRVDRLGHVLWQHDYGGQTERSIQSLVSLSSGDVVVSGQDSEKTWLARIAGDGTIVWERFVGIGKGSAVTTIGDIIVLVALKASESSQAYREDVALWSFSPTGEPLGERIVREGLNHFDGQRAADIRIKSIGDSAYVFSGWAAYVDIKPLAVTKLNTRREPLWTKELPVTVQSRDGRTLYCQSSLTVLSDNDVLIGCRTAPSQFALSRLSTTAGDLSEQTVELSGSPPPACARRWGPIRFLREKSQQVVWIFGSPGSVREPNGCGWIGEADMPAHKS